MKKHFLLLLFVLCGPSSFAQLSQGGTPLSADPGFSAKTSTILTVVMAHVDIASLRAQDEVTDVYKDIPWRFGQNIDVNLNLANSGAWDNLDNGGKIWRLRILSPGALSINLTFDNYHLPEGAKLFIYNDDRSQVIGAFTAINNRDDRIFATTLVQGEATTLEYFEPTGVEFPGEISISMVTHAYRGPYEYFEKSFGSSGSCQINARCAPTSTGWESQVKSVCLLVSGGSGFCTGALVNNTANNGTPYVLTANHCYSNPATWVFWFNWESAGCPNGTNPPYNSLSGATLRARDAGSDFCLVEINSAVPQNYNVFFAGWDRSGTPPTSGMAIHHPSGDIKKISPCNAMTATTWNSAACWQTPWSGPACTEPGSSGSPIFDQNHRVVGQLYGGPSACGASQMWDYYGRFNVSWTGAGTNSTRLSNWLDPLGTGPIVLDGYDPAGPQSPVVDFLADVTSSCTGVINFTDLSTYTPTSWLWSFGDGAVSSLQNPTHTYASNGVYSVQLTATNGVGPDTLLRTNYISISMPASPSVTGDTICNSGSVTLLATGSGILKWYDSLLGNTLLGTGPVYNTPVISATTIYYVEDSVVSASVNGGKPNNSGGGGDLTNQNQYLIFDCTSDMIIQSVSVYASVIGNRTFELRNSSGASLQTATVNITSISGAFTVPLNFSVPVGTDFQLGLTSGSTCNLYRNNAGVTYPYTTPGMFSITNSSAGATYYYYLYDWVVKGADCVSPRVPVSASVVTCTGMENDGLAELLIYPNPADKVINIRVEDPTPGTINISLFTVTGELVYSASLASVIGFKSSIDVSSFTSGIYFLKVDIGGKSTFRKVAVD